ncbi:6027a471-67d2-4207-bfcc-7c532ec37a2c [Sclerotinia trifoliorum]|uniref:Carboxylic ester hydrolase n=1 Tax=Sclerotinia trifoliorum TaxID=28548 RepID=A0A8H2VYE9_9HELO|nr:6027a471-67d2-4207-bfcc-7c532ec37a2c [Sclerotinia trifoliorum]
MFLLRELVPFLSLCAPSLVAAIPTSRTIVPTVTVKNGTYKGVHDTYYNQDFFLGVPYAQPPLNDLRFRVPQSLNQSWTAPKSATEYSRFCVGYGSDDFGHEVDEDCLYLNIIRPASIPENASLPVAFWIHGGGFYQGGSGDARYNLSYIVQNSVEMGTPMIGVSVQYRLSAWGFLGGSEVLESGNTNLGLRDQRLAMQWVHENIGNFGGDKKKVTIWGESAGAASVGAQLLAYNGRDDHLFRAAISESGGPAVLFFPVPYSNAYNSTTPQTLFQTLVANTTCAHTLSSNTTSTTSLQCLRTLTFSDLNSALNISTSGFGPFSPYIDHDFIADYPSKQLSAGKFVKVPYLIGTNTDEGTAFGSSYGPNGNGVNTDAEFITMLNSTGLPPSSNASLSIQSLYPNNQSVGIPSLEMYPDLFTPSNPLSASRGLQSRRVCAYIGDLIMHAPRRLTSLSWTKFNIPIYTYRFDVLVNGLPEVMGSTHFQEVAFVFNNTRGDGYGTNPFGNKSEGYFELASEISRRWVGFVTGLVPEAGVGARWPEYAGVRGRGRRRKGREELGFCADWEFCRGGYF